MRSRLVFPHSPLLDSGIRSHRRARLVLLVLALSCVLALPVDTRSEDRSDVDSGVYKWTDDDGRVHFGDRAPRDHDAEAVRIFPPPKGLGSAFPKPWQAGQPDWSADEQKAVREEEKRAAEREEDERKRRCQEARRRLAVLELDRPVYFVDAKGNEVFVEDDDRAAEIKRLKKVAADDCSG